jgi:hypothetical protein
LLAALANWNRREVLVRALVFAILAVSSLAPLTARADDNPGAALRGAAERCIRANAPRVEPVAKTLPEAVTFLVESLCAGEISRADAYARNEKLLARWLASPPSPAFKAPATGKPLSPYQQAESDNAARQAELLKQVKIDPRTGELDTPPDFEMTPKLTMGIVGAVFDIAYQDADFKSIAGEAVLAAAQAAAKH